MMEWLLRWYQRFLRWKNKNQCIFRRKWFTVYCWADTSINSTKTSWNELFANSNTCAKSTGSIVLPQMHGNNVQCQINRSDVPGQIGIDIYLSKFDGYAESNLHGFCYLSRGFDNCKWDTVYNKKLIYFIPYLFSFFFLIHS